MKTFCLIVILMFLFGCSGDDQITISLYIVSQDNVVSIAHANGETRDNFEGYTLWDGNGNCWIYIVPMEEVGEDSWNWILGHELRHCFYGDYHE